MIDFLLKMVPSEYNYAALKGCGKKAQLLSGRVKKGSLAAKVRMAYLRSLRGKGHGYYFGSEEQKRQRLNDRIRMDENHLWLKRQPVYGGVKLDGLNPLNAAPAYLKFTNGWLTDWIKQTKKQKAELERLKKLKQTRGGKFEPKTDIIDFLAGPLGWIKMGIRKKRQREIEQLKKELNL